MTIREEWKNHPLYSEGAIELVPTEWVWEYWGRDVSPHADLLDGTIVDLATLWEDLVKNGLYHPLIMRVGLQNKKFRLEAGNHRIQVLHEHGIPCIPLTVQVRNECGPHLSDVMTDATHNFDAPEGFLISTITREHMRPSDVFPSLAAVNKCSASPAEGQPEM